MHLDVTSHLHANFLAIFSTRNDDRSNREKINSVLKEIDKEIIEVKYFFSKHKNHTIANYNSLISP